MFVLSTGLLIWLRFSVTTLTVTNESTEVRLDVIVGYRTARFDSGDIECIEQEHEGDEVDDDSSCLVIRHSGRFPKRFLHYCPYAMTHWVASMISAKLGIPYRGSPGLDA